MIDRGNKNKNCEVIHSGIFEMSQWMQWMESRASHDITANRPIGHAFIHFTINTSESAAIYINISKLNTANVIILQNY
jgi:GTP-dependent phosphoenolpyruvate carboxykinase